MEEIDLENFLGVDFYVEFMAVIDVVTPPTSGIWFDLWKELKPSMIYWTYSRLLTHQPINVTRANVVQKDNDFSRQAAAKELSREQNRIGRIADNYSKKVIRFIIENKDDYPNFNGANTSSVTGFKLTIIKNDGRFI